MKSRNHCCLCSVPALGMQYGSLIKDIDFGKVQNFLFKLKMLYFCQKLMFRDYHITPTP